MSLQRGMEVNIHEQSKGGNPNIGGLFKVFHQNLVPVFSISFMVSKFRVATI